MKAALGETKSGDFEQLVETMLQRMCVVIKAKGDPIKYA